ncbi:ribosomal protein L22e, partial [Vararia minispora EC-137]
SAAGKQKFIVDYSRPAADELFDGAAFEKFLHDRIKVEGKAGQLGDNIKIHREGNKQITLTAAIPFSKRYLKYLTKKFLKKQTLSDFLHPVATTKEGFVLKYYNIQ